MADSARFDDVGDEISYVICRNINFTNICYVGCSFCGFARHKHEEDAYDRTLEDVVGRAREAVERGASEVCIQGGIHPNKDGFWYREIVRAIKARAARPAHPRVLARGDPLRPPEVERHVACATT